MLPDLKAADWDTAVLESTLPVLVDVYSTHCPPCRALGPIIDGLATEFEGRAKVVKLNTEDNTEAAVSLHVSSVPTVLAFRNGKEIGRLIGLRPAAAYRQLLEQAGVG
jgi:thioredoxin 1